jgi:hypothetical protein
MLGAICWPLLALSYFLFAGQVDAHETIGGLPAALAAAAFAVALQRRGERRFGLRAPWGRLIAAVLVALPIDCGRVGGVLLRTLWRRPAGPLGARLAQAFVPGGKDAPSAGRRAIVALAASVAPNRYVLGCERSGQLVLHELAPAPAPRDPMWPV